MKLSLCKVGWSITKGASEIDFHLPNNTRVRVVTAWAELRIFLALRVTQKLIQVVGKLWNAPNKENLQRWFG